MARAPCQEPGALGCLCAAQCMHVTPIQGPLSRSRRPWNGSWSATEIETRKRPATEASMKKSEETSASEESKTPEQQAGNEDANGSQDDADDEVDASDDSDVEILVALAAL